MEAEIQKSQGQRFGGWKMVLLGNIAIVVTLLYIWGPQVWPVVAVSAVAWGFVAVRSRKEGERIDDVAKPIARAAKFVEPRVEWNSENLRRFLQALPTECIIEIRRLLGLAERSESIRSLTGENNDVAEILRQVVWLSSNILTYPFKDTSTFDYHQLVTWIASSSGVPAESIENASTFFIERAIQKQIFAQLWDKLTPEQRLELLDKIDKSGEVKDKAAVAALGGAGAVAVLSATVAFAGFTFYTTMSVTICAVAGFFGATLPFSVYAGAATLTAFLSGPVGLAIGALLLFGGVALAGRANVKKSTEFVCQLHAIKVAALLEAGVPESEIFS